MSERLSFVPAGGGLGAARWRERGQYPGLSVGDQPDTAAPSGFMGWGGAGGNSVPQISTIPDPGQGPDHSNSESSAPGPCARPAHPPSCFLHLAGGESSLLQVHPQRCKQTKTKRCLIEKIKETMASRGIWRPCPCPSFAAPAPALLSRATPTPTWYRSHRLTQERVGAAFGDSARSSQRLCLHRPSGAPAPAAPSETTGGGAARFSGSVLKGKHFGASSPGGAPHHHPRSRAQSVSCSSSSCPPGHPRHLRAGSLRPVPSAASLSRGASRGSQDAGQGGGGRLGQRVQLGGLRLCRGRAARLRLRRLTVLPVQHRAFFTCGDTHRHTNEAAGLVSSPSPQASHTALRVPKSISAPRNGLWPWGAEDVLRRAPALPGDLAQTPVPQPQPLRAPHSKGSRAAP